ncbi:MAG: tyrosine-type recombinase/integrase [Pseudomonadota bacterium]
MVTATTRPTDTTATPPTERIDWDDEVPGLGLRLRPSGTASWILQRRVDGRMKKTTLGRANDIHLALARELARETVALPTIEAAPAEVPTLAAFAERFLADCAGRWKPATAIRHGRDVQVRIVPGLGRLRVDRITRDDVTAWRDALAAASSGGTSDRALAVLSGIMRHAEALGLRRPGTNPCRGLRRRKTGFKAQRLGRSDWARLGAVLDDRDEAAPVLTGIVRFIALTGCRRGEAVGLEWDWVQRDRALLPDSKSGPRTLWLGRELRQLLAALPRTSSPRVFPGKHGGSIDAELTAFWLRARQAAGLPRLRLHDLRHGFATVAVESGITERVLAGLLGHRDFAATATYVHLPAEAVSAAAERVGAHLDKSLGKGRPRKRKAACPQRGRKVPVYTDPAVKRFLAGKVGLPEFCAREGLDEAAFRCSVEAARRAAQNSGERAHA